MESETRHQHSWRGMFLNAEVIKGRMLIDQVLWHSLNALV